MLRNILTFFLFISAVQASGELSFVMTPRSISLSGNADLKSLYIGDVCLAALGYAISLDATWPGLAIENPFDLGKTSIIVIYVNGIFSIATTFHKYKTYSLRDSDAEESLDYLVAQLPKGSVHDFNLSNQNQEFATFQDHFKNRTLPLSMEYIRPDDYFNHKLLVEEIGYIDRIAEHLAELLQPSHVLIIRLSLERISRISPYGTINEAKVLIEYAVDKLRSTASYLQSPVLFITATNKRVAMKAIKSSQTKKLASPFQDIGADDNLPVVIQICVWFTLVFILLVAVVCYQLASIDPGQESINYRLSPVNMSKKTN